MKSQHTPTPWVRDDGAIYQEGYVKNNENCICHLLFHSGKPEEEVVANAAFIVRACNSHDELLRLLSEANEFLECYWDEGPSGEGWQSKKLINLISDIEQIIKTERES